MTGKLIGTWFQGLKDADTEGARGVYLILADRSLRDGKNMHAWL